MEPIKRQLEQTIINRENRIDGSSHLSEQISSAAYSSMNKRAGFTVIELLVVIAIIAILTGLLVPR